jgi:hypothetical protein
MLKAPKNDGAATRRGMLNKETSAQDYFVKSAFFAKLVHFF